MEVNERAMRVQTEITFTSDGNTLAGALIHPGSEGVVPAALLISGSGPLDRNSDTKKMKLGVMGQVASHLEARGIASFRFDRRGVGASSGDFYTTGLYDNVADAQAALDTLREASGVDAGAVLVVGHSEGAVIATELAARNPDLAGVVLLAGPAASGEEVLRWQATKVADALPKPARFLMRVMRQDIVKSQTKKLARLKATTTDSTRMQMAKVNAKWFREFLAHDPRQSLSEVRVPVLAVTGSKDIQVDPAHVDRICDLVPGECSGHVLEDMSHLLRSEEGAPSLSTYKKQVREPVRPDLLDRISGWILDHSKGSNDATL